MIALRVSLNGKVLCLAGAEDLSVLSTTVTAVGCLGAQSKRLCEDTDTPDFFFTVGGLTNRQTGDDFHLRWASQELLAIGDKVEIELVEVSGADAPIAMQKAKTPESP